MIIFDRSFCTECKQILYHLAAAVGVEYSIKQCGIAIRVLAIDARATPEQQISDVWLIMNGREMKGRLERLINRIHVCASLQKFNHNIVFAILGRIEQWRPSITISLVHFRAGFN